MDEKLLLEVLIENRQLKVELAKAKENENFWWHEWNNLKAAKPEVKADVV